MSAILSIAIFGGLITRSAIANLAGWRGNSDMESMEVDIVFVCNYQVTNKN